MTIILTTIHVLIAILLILAVLLQAGKGGGLAASLGGGMSSSNVLGGRAATTFLSKATTVLASSFLVSCLILSLVYDEPDEAPTTATERVLQSGGAIPAAPMPFAETVPETGAEENPSVLGGEGKAEAGTEEGDGD